MSRLLVRDGVCFGALAFDLASGERTAHLADAVILCTGGTNRRLPVPGFELTATHSDAWALTAVPDSMLVVGVGATGAQVASVFDELGSRVQLFEAGPRILATEDPDVSAPRTGKSGSSLWSDPAWGGVIVIQSSPVSTVQPTLRSSFASAAMRSVSLTRRVRRPVNLDWVLRVAEATMRAMLPSGNSAQRHTKPSCLGV